MLNLRHLLQAVTLSMLISGCGVTAQISKLASELTPTPSPTYEDLTDGPAITINNPLDLSTVPTTGTGPYTYEIIEGSGSISGSTYTPGATTGDVIIKITDANGDVSHIKIPVAPTPTVSPAQVFLGVSDTFDFSGANGVPPYTYSATGGTIDSSGLFTADGSTGAATVTVTDSLGNTHTLNLTIRPALNSAVTASTMAATSTVTMSGIDGAGGYTYSLVSGSGSIHASTGVYSPGGTSGTVVLRVTDAAGKTSDQSVTVAPLLTISPINKIILVNTTTTFTASGGVPPYSYAVGIGNTGTVGLTTGAYQAPGIAASETVTVTDALGTTATATVQVNPPVKISATKTKYYTNTSITVSGADGIPPYTYSLIMGTGTLNSTTGEFTTTTIGTKRFRVTDSTGASTTLITTAYNPLLTSTFKVAINSVITFTPSGGIPPYTTTLLSGGGSLSLLNYTAPGTLGVATIQVTDAGGTSVNVTADITNPPSISQFEISGPYISDIVNVSAAGSEYDKWCILEGLNYVSACVWQNGTLPAVFDTNKLYREGRSYFAFVSRGSAVASASSHKFFNSTFPLGSKNNFGSPSGIATSSDGFWIADSSLNKVFKYDANGNWLMTLGSDNPTAQTGFFKYLARIFVDSNDRLYVVDQGNDRIQIFDASGSYSRTVPADGVMDSPTNGHFENPWAVYVDNSGNMYVADNTGRVQKFDSTGNWVFTFGSLGTGNGQFSVPRDIEVDSSGNIFVMDYGNSRVQKFDSNGTWLATFGGPGTTDGLFDAIADIEIAPSGEIYVMDKNRLQIFNSAFVFQSSSPIGTGENLVNYAHALSLDSLGNFYVLQSGNQIVSKFNNSLVHQFTVGSTVRENGSFNNPQNIFRDSSGNLWVVERTGCRVQKFSSTGTWLMAFGSCGTGNGEFKEPTAVVTASDGSIYVADSLNLRIQKFDSSGTYLSQFPFGQVADMVITSSDVLYASRSSTKDAVKFATDGSIIEVYSSGAIGTVQGLAVDASGSVYVADPINAVIHKFSHDAIYLGTIGGPGTGNGQFGSISDLTFAPNGDIYVLENGGVNRVQIFDSTGTYKSQFSSFGYGIGQLVYPMNIVIDPTNENIYIVEPNRHRVQKFNSSGAPLLQ